MRTGLAAMQGAEFAYNDYLERIDPRDILEHYGAENGFEQVNVDGTREIIHSCLLDRIHTHHQNGDEHPSAAMNLDKKTYVCYSYSDPEPGPHFGKSGYDVFHFIRKMERKATLHDIVPILLPLLQGTAKESSVLRDQLIKAIDAASRAASPTFVPGVSARMLAGWAVTHPYVVERGIDLETASRMGIGYDGVENRITIPHWFAGKLVGWQKRAIPERPGEWPGTLHPEPKYRSSPGFPKSTTLYNWDSAIRDRGRVLVVESPFSVIKAEALGVPGTVATFGSKVTDRQVELLREFRHVTVWGDPDAAGAGMERRLTQALDAHTKVSVVTPDFGSDMGDCSSAEQILDKIATAVPAVLKLAQWQKEKKAWQKSMTSSTTAPRS